MAPSPQIILLLSLFSVLFISAQPTKEEKLDESERFLPLIAWAVTKLFNCYETSCWTSTKDLMVGVNLWDKKMYRDNNIKEDHSTIKWTQYSRCWWECQEDFVEVSYRENDGDGDNPVFKVLVADGQTIPDSFTTTGYNDMLNLALFHDDVDTEVDVMVFAIMPSDWKIYQNRFYTSSIRKFVGVASKVIAVSAGKYIATAVLVGAAAGSVVPGPGTAIGIAIAASGAAAGYVVADNFDDFFGQYTHHIG